MKNKHDPIDDFPPAMWERIRRDHQLLETFQASPVHLKAKSRLREILTRPSPTDIPGEAEKKTFPEG
jgi:hypothetical protein